MRLIIAGSRRIRDYKLVYEVINRGLEAFGDKTPSVVISGGQVSIDRDTGERYGVDYIGEAWAKYWNIPVEKYLAEWSEHGKAAGPIRNAYMAKRADALILIRYHDSKGSASMLREAKRQNLKIYDYMIGVNTESRHYVRENGQHVLKFR